MKLVLLKNVIGINRVTGEKRLHAEAGDTLPVVLLEGNFYWCPSKRFEDEFIPVLPSQVDYTKPDEPDKSDNINNYEEDATESEYPDLEYFG